MPDRRPARPVVLFTFVRPGPAIWILVGIPVVFMGAMTLVGPFGMTLNLMSLTGFIVVLGMVVDDAVVVSERIALKRAQGSPPSQAALDGAGEMLAPVTAAALTTMLAFLPLTVLGGLPRQDHVADSRRCGLRAAVFPVRVVLRSPRAPLNHRRPGQPSEAAFHGRARGPLRARARLGCCGIGWQRSRSRSPPSPQSCCSCALSSPSCCSRSRTPTVC